jgi:hypothetical protein
MSFGYGQAMFNFYSAFPYYLGELIRLVTQYSLIDTVKILLAISLIAGGVGMYLLGREFFGKLGGFVAAVLYIFAPYRAVNVYVRGALAEAFSMAILPFLWLLIYKTINKPNYKNIILLAFVLMFLLTTHNISTLMYALPTAIWTVYWLIRNRNIKSLLGVFLGSVAGVGLAGFFVIPMLFEKSLTREEVFTSGYSSFIAHYVSVSQLFFSRFWDYGGSIFGDNDHMSFQVGWPHWWVAVGLGVYSVVGFIKQKKTVFLLILGLIAMTLISLFLAHSRSTFIWQKIPVLAFIQFPWRLVGLSVFLISFAGAGITLIKPRKAKYFVVSLVVVVAILLNYQYFRPDMHFYGETDETKLSGALFYTQQQAAVSDYLPRTSKAAPLELAPQNPEVISGTAEIRNFTKTAGTFFFDANVVSQSVLDVPIIYFPGWRAFVLAGQGEELEIVPGGDLGVIRISLPVGSHMVEGRFSNTPTRNLGNALTVLSFFALVIGFLISINKNETTD